MEQALGKDIHRSKYKGPTAEKADWSQRSPPSRPEPMTSAGAGPKEQPHLEQPKQQTPWEQAQTTPSTAERPLGVMSNPWEH